MARVPRTCSLGQLGGRQGAEGESRPPLRRDIEVKPRGGKSLATGPQVTGCCQDQSRAVREESRQRGWEEGASTFPHFQEFIEYLVSSWTGPSATSALPRAALTSFSQAPFRMLVFDQGRGQAGPECGEGVLGWHSECEWSNHSNCHMSPGQGLQHTKAGPVGLGFYSQALGPPDGLGAKSTTESRGGQHPHRPLQPVKSFGLTLLRH